MLLQESNFIARQPCRAPMTLDISFDKCCRLANEGLVNPNGDRVFQRLTTLTYFVYGHFYALVNPSAFLSKVV